jgi:glycyl-tRNA synthetase beta subunit
MTKLKILLTFIVLSMSHHASAKNDNCTQMIDSAIMENAELINFFKQRIKALTAEKEALLSEGKAVDSYRDRQLASLANTVAINEGKQALWKDKRNNDPDCKLLSDSTIKNILKGSVY